MRRSRAPLARLTPRTRTRPAAGSGPSTSPQPLPASRAGTPPSNRRPIAVLSPRSRVVPLEPRAVGREANAPGRGNPLELRLREFLRGLGQLQRRADVLQAVLEATSTTRVPERIAAKVVDLAVGWFGGEAWAILAVSEGRGLRWLGDRGVLHGQREAMSRAAARAVSRSTIVWSSGSAPPGRSGTDPGVSIVAIPVRSHGRPVAVLVGLDLASPARAAAPASGGTRAAKSAPDGKGAAEPPLDARRAAPLLALVGAVGGPLDTALRLKRANALTSIDDLTGLYNSRFLADALRREVKRAVRTGQPLSLLFVDLDGFKGINDRYGHLCGSRALVEAGERIQAGARDSDIVARFGGDEFSLILPDTDREGAMLVARRVRERVAGHPFLASEGIGYRLTASVGAATLSGATGTPESLLAAADTAMYRVKGRGKDGIEMADLVPPSKQS